MNHWIEVSGAKLWHNVAAVQQVVGESIAVMAVVKANAYGHGAETVAPVLAGAGVEWLGVTDAEEGVRVKRSLSASASQQVSESASQPSILVMSGLCEEEASDIVTHDLVATVWSAEQIAWLDAAARAADTIAQVHVEVDSGMSRQGAQPGAELLGVFNAIQRSKHVQMNGIFTHFAAAEMSGSPQTLDQQAAFEDAMRQVTTAGLQPEWVHAGNSSFIDEALLLDWLRRQATAVSARAMARPGIALYGYVLPLEIPEWDANLGEPVPKAWLSSELQPVMTWKAKVIGLREVPARTRIGYSGAYVAQRMMKLALLPVGYADGLRRELSSSQTREPGTEKHGGWVMLRGQRAPIVGRVSMNLTIVDVTEIAGVALGDVATVLGAGITANDHARMAETLPYEILCGVRGDVVLV